MPTGLEGFSPQLGGLEGFGAAVPEAQREPDFPTLDSVVGSEEFKSLDNRKKAVALQRFEDSYIDFLRSEGVVQSDEDADRELSLVKKATLPHFPSGIGAGASTLTASNPLEDLRAAGLSLAQRIQEFRKSHARDVFIEEDLGESVSAISKERDALQDEMANNIHRQGAAILAERGGAFSPASLGTVANQLSVDLPVGVGLSLLAGPKAGIAYFFGSGAARADLSQRQLEAAGRIEDRTPTESLTRSLGVGAAAAALDSIGLGKLLGPWRTKMFSEAVKKVTAAAGAEAGTEFAQTIVEAVGTQAEGIDDVLLVASKAAPEAVEAGIIGGLFGGSIAGAGQAGSFSIDRFYETPAVTNFLSEKTEKVSGIIQDFNKNINDAGRISAAKKLEDEIGVLGEFDAENIPEIGSESGISAEDILTKEQAAQQGEAIPESQLIQSGLVTPDKQLIINEVEPVIEAEFESLLRNDDFIRQYDIGSPQEFAEALFRTGRFDQIESSIEGVLSDRPNINADDVIANSINKFFRPVEQRPQTAQEFADSEITKLMEDPDFRKTFKVGDEEGLELALDRIGKSTEIKKGIREIDKDANFNRVLGEAIEDQFLDLPKKPAQPTHEIVFPEARPEPQRQPSLQELQPEVAQAPVDVTVEPEVLIPETEAITPVEFEEAAKAMPPEDVPLEPIKVDFAEKGVRSQKLGISTSPIEPAKMNSLQRDLAIGDGDKPLAGGRITKFVREWFTKERKLGNRIFQASRTRQNKINELSSESQILDRQLKIAIKKELGSTPKNEQIEALNEFLAGKNVEIPESLRKPLTDMRNKVDSMSKELIASGAISGDLISKVEGNLGTYLYRGYKVFNDKKWKDKVGTEEKEAARNYFIKQIKSSKANKDLTEAQVQDRADGMINEILTAEDIDIAPNVSGTSKNVDILKKRKLNDMPELRALMGEIKDPRVNFMSSMVKMSSLLANQNFLAELKDIGLKDGWLSKDQTGKNSRLFSSKNSKVTDPLNGLYIDPEVHTEIENYFKRSPLDPMLKPMLQATAVAKIGKTALSPSSQVRNFAANQLFMVAGGYTAGWKTASKTTLSNLGFDHVNKNFDKTIFSEQIAYYNKLGILGDSINSNEIQNILKESEQRNEDMDTFFTRMMPRAAKWSYDKALALYGAGDDFFKIIAFESEKKRYAKAGIEKTDREIAEIVTDIMPTYSKTSRIIDGIRKIPFIGTFPSFPAEIFRTTVNHYRLGLKESKSDNAAERKIGVMRLIRLTSSLAIPAALTALGEAAMGVEVSDDEDSDIRRLVAPWSRFSNLLYISNPEDGKIRYIDTGFSDPFAVFKKPLRAFADGNHIDAAIELASPFLGIDMVTERLINIIANKKSGSQAKVFEPTDSGKDKFNKSIAHLWGALEPGFWTSFKRIYEGHNEVVNDFGRSRNRSDELIAFFSGTRFSEVQAPQALQFKTSELLKNRASVKKDLNRETFTKRSNQTLQEFKDAEERFLIGNKLYFDEIVKDVKAAETMGMSSKKIRAVLRNAGVEGSLISQIMRNKYKEPDLSREAKARKKKLEKKSK
jgi:hypothetical protein